MGAAKSYSTITEVSPMVKALGFYRLVLMAALTNTWWPLPPNSVTRTWNCRVPEKFIILSRITPLACPVYVVFVREGIKHCARNWNHAGRSVKKRIIARRKHGWQNRVRGGNIDNFSSRRYLHFSASIRNTRIQDTSFGFLGHPGRKIFHRWLLFLLFTPCQLGFCCVHPRAAGTHKWEWDVCELLYACKWLVWHVCLHTGARVITSKYASSCRIFIQSSFLTIERLFLSVSIILP